MVFTNTEAVKHWLCLYTNEVKLKTSSTLKAKFGESQLVMKLSGKFIINFFNENETHLILLLYLHRTASMMNSFQFLALALW